MSQNIMFTNNNKMGKLNLRNINKNDVLNSFVEGKNIVVLYNDNGNVKENKINIDGRLHLDLLRKGVLSTEGTRWKLINNRIYDRATYDSDNSFVLEQKTKEDENVAKAKIKRSMKYSQLDKFNNFSHFRVNLKTNNLRDLYYAIKVANEEKADGDGYINLHFQYADSQSEEGYKFKNKRIRSTTINQNFLDTYEEFVERILQIRRGEVEGSDKMNDNQLTLIMDRFDIKYIEDNVFGINKILFECEGMGTEKEKNCGIETIKFIYNELDIEFDENNYDNKDFNTLKKFVDFLRMNLNNVGALSSINIFGNTIKRESTKWKKEIKKKDFIKVDGKKLYKMKKDILQPYFMENMAGIEEHKINFDGCVNIVYDFINNHIDVLKNPLTIKEDIYISRCIKMYRKTDKKKYIKIFNATQLKKNAMKPPTHKHKYIVFDYETIVDWSHNSILKPYALSYFVCDDEDLKEIDKADSEKNTPLIKEIVKSNCYNDVGWNCTKSMYDYITKNQEDTIFTLISFNGCNFDNFILADWLYKNQMENISNPCYTNSQLLNFTINGRHNLFDLRRHVVGSLAHNCKSFKISSCAKKELDHNLVQLDYEKDTKNFINKMKLNEKMIEYNNFDVLSTGLLYHRYEKTFKDSDHTKYIELRKKLTIGSIIWEVFEKYNKETKLPKLDFETYNAIVKHRVAGRVELFNGSQIVDECVASEDICSLYPYICAVNKCYFPCGEIVKSSWEDYQIIRKTQPNLIGFFWCKVDQTNLKKRNLPQIYPLKTKIKNDWKTPILEEVYLSSVIIDALIENKCKVDFIDKSGIKTFYETIEFKKSYGIVKAFENGIEDPLKKFVNKKLENDDFIISVIRCKENDAKIEVEYKKYIQNNGIYFTEVMKNFEMFGFLLDFMKGKNDQDKLKGTTKYNSALRETLKLLMNSISGKVAEGLHADKVKMVNEYEYHKIKENSKTSKINAIDIKGNSIFMSYSLNEEDLIKKQRPVYLGTMIYDYAKMMMYNHIYSKVGLKNLLYTDTDCCKFTKTIGDNWISHYSGKAKMKDLVWDNVLQYDDRYKKHKLYEEHSKVFGSFENELSEDNIKSYITMKKCYLIIKEKNEIDAFSFKGVSKTNLYLTGEEDFIGEKITKHRNGTQTIKKFIKSQTEARDFYLKYSNERQLVRYEGKKMINVKAVQLFDDLHTKKYAYVLSFSFVKSFKNSARNVGLDDEDKFNKNNSNLRMVYQIKKLKLC